jgi:hypothetical protein
VNLTRASASLFATAAFVGATLLSGAVVTPVAFADTLPNGLTVNCTKDSDIHSSCVVGGCPRVNGDYVVDVLHVMYPGGGQKEHDFKCINGQTHTVGSIGDSPVLTFGVQACRKKDFEGDWCIPYASYTFNPPAPAAPPPPPPPPVAAPAPPPPPPVTTAPKPAPKNAVTMNIDIGAFGAKVSIASSADIAGTCTYNASNPQGLPGVNRTFDLAPNGTFGFNTPPPGLATYNIVLSCKGPFDGKTIEYGHVEQTVGGL